MNFQGVTWSQGSFLGCGCPTAPAPLAAKTIFLPWIALHLRGKWLHLLIRDIHSRACAREGSKVGWSNSVFSASSSSPTLTFHKVPRDSRSGLCRGISRGGISLSQPDANISNHAEPLQAAPRHSQTWTPTTLLQSRQLKRIVSLLSMWASLLLITGGASYPDYPHLSPYSQVAFACH